jgi:hypothetical protein
VIDPSLPADRSTSECWSLLPGPERLMESAYVLINGRPALVVTTRSAVKLGLFAEKWVRVFFMQTDRTRRGLPPAAAFETRMNLWQAAHILMLDADHDGRDDLVLGYWKGLKNHHLVLDAYLQKEDGTFSDSARTTTFEVESADRSFLEYGHDLDGDARPDLVLLAGGRLLVFPASPKSKKGSDLVVEKARWSLPLKPTGVIHVNGTGTGAAVGRAQSPDRDRPVTGRRGADVHDAAPDATSGDDEQNVENESLDGSDTASAGGDDENFDLEAVDSEPGASGRDGDPKFIDLDGDGAEEIYTVVNTLNGGSHFVIYRFPRAAAGG